MDTLSIEDEAEIERLASSNPTDEELMARAAADRGVTELVTSHSWTCCRPM
jgi:hypothetical protein